MQWNKEWIMGAFNGAAITLALVFVTELSWFLVDGDWSPALMGLVPATLLWTALHTSAALKWRRELKARTVRNRPTI